MKKIISGLIFTAIIWTFTPSSASAQLQQFSQPTYLTGPTNSGVILTTPFNLQLPQISLTFSGATNPLTTVTNTITQVLQITNTVTFVYNAATYGTNFTTNFPSFNFLVTNQTVGWAFPQSGGSNTCSVK